MEGKHFVLFLAIGSFLGGRVDGNVCRTALLCRSDSYTNPTWSNVDTNDMGDGYMTEDFLEGVSDLQEKVNLLNEQFEELKGKDGNASKNETPSVGNSAVTVKELASTTSQAGDYSTSLNSANSVTTSDNLESTTSEELDQTTTQSTTEPVTTFEDRKATTSGETGQTTTHSTADSEMLERRFESITSLATNESNIATTTAEDKENCSGSVGITRIYPATYRSGGTLVYCDNVSDDGGWIIFQRRRDGTVNFNRIWDDYVNGFGDMEGEFWMGLRKLHLLLSDGNYELRVDLQDWEGNRAYAKYSTFSVGNSSDNYRLRVGGYSGTAGDSMTYHDNQQFSTSDRDNDIAPTSSCSQIYQGGWWFGKCHYAHPNGVYHDQRKGAPTYLQGIVWYHWKGYYYSLKSMEMKFRRKQN